MTDERPVPWQRCTVSGASRCCTYIVRRRGPTRQVATPAACRLRVGGVEVAHEHDEEDNRDGEGETAKHDKGKSMAARLVDDGE